MAPGGSLAATGEFGTVPAGRRDLFVYSVRVLLHPDRVVRRYRDGHTVRPRYHVGTVHTCIILTCPMFLIALYTRGGMMLLQNTEDIVPDGAFLGFLLIFFFLLGSSQLNSDVFSVPLADRHMNASCAHVSFDRTVRSRDALDRRGSVDLCQSAYFLIRTVAHVGDVSMSLSPCSVPSAYK